MRYRSIDVRIWGDKKFRSLSPIQPSGQGLFLYLLTNPNTTSIPGIYRAGAAAMAEELGWPIGGFRIAFDELIKLDLIKADLNARVIFIPNAIKYNKPQSPNVVKSWASHWDEVPECELKYIAFQILETFIKAMGKAFHEAFLEAFREATGKPLIKVMSNQEQKQEQKIKYNAVHEDLSFSDNLAATLSITGIQGAKHLEAYQVFEYWQLVMNSPRAKFDSKRKKIIDIALRLGFSVDELKQAIDGCSKTPHNMGENPQKKRYNDIGLIFRDADHIERFMSSANTTLASAKDDPCKGAI